MSKFAALVATIIDIVLPPIKSQPKISSPTFSPQILRYIKLQEKKWAREVGNNKARVKALREIYKDMFRDVIDDRLAIQLVGCGREDLMAWLGKSKKKKKG